MLRRGEVVALERTSTLLQRFAGMQLFAAFLARRAARSSCARWKSIRAPPPARNHLLRLASYDDVEPILAQCRAAGCTFDEIEVRKADLEDVFVQVMNEPEVIEGLA